MEIFFLCPPVQLDGWLFLGLGFFVLWGFLFAFGFVWFFVVGLLFLIFWLFLFSFYLWF